MNLLNEFGINPIMLIANIVNFLIIFWVLKKYLYKPLLANLKKREHTIKEGLKQAEEARMKLEETSQKEKEVLRTAQTQAKKIIDDAKHESQILMHRTEDSMKKKTDAMLEDARAQIQEEAKKTEQRLAAKVSTLAVEFLKKSIKGVFSEKTQEEIMDKAVKKFKQRPN